MAWSGGTVTVRCSGGTQAQNDWAIGVADSLSTYYGAWFAVASPIPSDIDTSGATIASATTPGEFEIVSITPVSAGVIDVEISYPAAWARKTGSVSYPDPGSGYFPAPGVYFRVKVGDSSTVFGAPYSGTNMNVAGGNGSFTTAGSYDVRGVRVSFALPSTFTDARTLTHGIYLNLDTTTTLIAAPGERKDSAVNTYTVGVEDAPSSNPVPFQPVLFDSYGGAYFFNGTTFGSTPTITRPKFYWQNWFVPGAVDDHGRVDIMRCKIGVPSAVPLVRATADGLISPITVASWGESNINAQSPDFYGLFSANTANFSGYLSAPPLRRVGYSAGYQIGTTPPFIDYGGALLSQVQRPPSDVSVGGNTFYLGSLQLQTATDAAIATSGVIAAIDNLNQVIHAYSEYTGGTLLKVKSQSLATVTEFDDSAVSGASDLASMFSATIATLATESAPPNRRFWPIVQPHDNAIIVTDGLRGAWISHDTGATWAALPDFAPPSETLGTAEADTLYLYPHFAALGGNGIGVIQMERGTYPLEAKFWRSFDVMQTWEGPFDVGTLPDSVDTYPAVGLFPVPTDNRLVACNGADSLWVSADTGETWTAA